MKFTVHGNRWRESFLARASLLLLLSICQRNSQKMPQMAYLANLSSLTFKTMNLSKSCVKDLQYLLFICFSNTTIRVTSYWSMVVKPAYSKMLWTQNFTEPFNIICRCVPFRWFHWFKGVLSAHLANWRSCGWLDPEFERTCRYFHVSVNLPLPNDRW